MDSNQLDQGSSAIGSIASTLPIPGAAIVGTAISGIGKIASMVMASKEQEKAAREMAYNQLKASETAQYHKNILPPKVVELGLGGLASRIMKGSSSRSSKDMGMTLEGNTHENGGTVTADNAIAEKGEFTYQTSDGKKLVFSNRF